jgi:RNA polymerase sigma-70 factor (ECF subfamily)
MEEIASPRAYLSTVVTRLAMDRLKSAQARREVYVGEWLPEPLLGEGRMEDPAERIESVNTAFLLLLERLRPVERAVFLLHDVFDYGYPEISEIVGETEANCRQMTSRARKRIREGQPRFDPAPHEAEQLAVGFLDACSGGDMENLLELLTTDVTYRADGGGVVSAATRPVHGAKDVSRLLLGLWRKRWTGVGARLANVNGGAGIVLYGEGRLYAVITFALDGDRISDIYVVVNPTKLQALESRWQEST